MEEMNATVLEVAKNAQQAADVSHQAREQALEGSQIVNKAVKGIESVHTQSIAIKGRALMPLGQTGRKHWSDHGRYCRHRRSDQSKGPECCH